MNDNCKISNPRYEECDFCYNGEVKKITWGRYKGYPVEALLDADDSYIIWLFEKTEDDWAAWEKEYLNHYIEIKEKIDKAAALKRLNWDFGKKS